GEVTPASALSHPADLPAYDRRQPARGVDRTQPQLVIGTPSALLEVGIGALAVLDAIARDHVIEARARRIGPPPQMLREQRETPDVPVVSDRADCGFQENARLHGVLSHRPRLE